MARHLLPALTLLFALPAGAMIWQGQDLSRVFAAVAAPTDLLDGCGDVPEAVALAEELRDRALRIERYMESIDARKAELAQAEATAKHGPRRPNSIDTCEAGAFGMTRGTVSGWMRFDLTL